ncbi:glycoside hydrolase family 88 protein [Enterococcus faecium]|uniref:glycoside hydrolase family 88 protein n=1 Tax=Enterococcus faecium TaxID=1352 RepID=UPI00280D3253|nr:glycoside hydrolase family 88 protein [Enterococcus faecium]MDQ8322402.1 glycoside hydrolase family 88 protein [Enterococcus faecium]MDQ8481278.1 glycoside hydrolase family 88 protein [Enterococcus faecium]MEB7868785.1 glycoside hydrolase family 88 protein [Enterococcus faecium]
MMKNITHEKLVGAEKYFNSRLLSEKEIDQAIKIALKKIDHNISKLGELFPTPATKGNVYEPMQNVEWTNGFWTGILWLSYELTGDCKYKNLAEKHVKSFLNRIEKEIEVDHHDLGFLYSLSCVSSYKLTGNKDAKRAGLLAAEKLVSRYQNKGNFIQAWGELGSEENYRLIVDCLLNIPLLFWAAQETGKNEYKDIAINHYKTTVQNVIREDASSFHTFYFDSKTGDPLFGKTRQGFSDESSWARGQAWLIYGIALCHSYIDDEKNIYLFESITNYYLNRLPEDFINYWDLIFSDGSNQSRDSSASAISICGLNLMGQYLPEANQHKLVYKYAQHSILSSLIDNYTETKTSGITALINEGVYSWHSGKGINEGNIWGDYFYLEALVRFKKNWKMYW